MGFLVRVIQRKKKNYRTRCSALLNDDKFNILIDTSPDLRYQLITNKIKIPTIGIGSSSYCDGQILVTDDMLGLSGFYPKFVKKYLNLNRIIEKAVKKYTKEVKLAKFPSNKYFLNEPRFR